MSLMQLVYVSRPFGFDDLALAGILASARANNARDGVTGALICREDIYLQWLEGPPDAVGAAFERIRRDDRHMDVNTLLSSAAPARLFPHWAMRDDPARSWLWSRAEVGAGRAARATPEDVRAIFVRLSEEPERCPAAGQPH